MQNTVGAARDESYWKKMIPVFILYLYTHFRMTGAVTGASHLSRPAAADFPAGPSSSSSNHPLRKWAPTILSFLRARTPLRVKLPDNNNNNFESFLSRPEVFDFVQPAYCTSVCVRTLLVDRLDSTLRSSINIEY